MASQADKGQAFRLLHERGEAFVIPNPWDVGSAKVLQGLGFEALATTSSGFAHTLGRADGQVTLEEKLAHCRALAAATDIPVSADMEDGFAAAPDGVAATLRGVVETGVVGASVEDFSRDQQTIYDFDLAVERVHAAVEVVRGCDFPFTLTARAENLLRGRDDLDDTIRRLQAFREAGADVLYAPGLKTLEEIAAVAAAVPGPLNVLVPFLPGKTVAQLARAGATRLSLGGALAFACVTPSIEAGREMIDTGSFSWLAGMPERGLVAKLLG